MQNNKDPLKAICFKLKYV